LLLIEGRAVATSGGSTAAKGSAELDPNAIKKLIDSNRKDFDTHARELHDAVQEAIAAIDARNVEQLVESGGRIDHVCEQCHKQFWYPNDKRPTSVTGALSHKS
jgi:cytochrome c556